MAAIRRLISELKDLKSGGYHWLKDVKVQKDDIFHWVVTLKPDVFPYNQACYVIQLNFPLEYPLKPPKVYFDTPIYHPNVDANGITRFPHLAPENWIPKTSPNELLKSIIDLFKTPYLLHPLREDLAEDYSQHKYKFLKNALDHAKRHGEYCD